MGGPWGYPSNHPLLNVHTWPSGKTMVIYEVPWPSRSERVWYFEAEQ